MGNLLTHYLSEFANPVMTALWICFDHSTRWFHEVNDRSTEIYLQSAVIFCELTAWFAPLTECVLHHFPLPGCPYEQIVSSVLTFSKAIKARIYDPTVAPNHHHKGEL